MFFEPSTSTIHPTIQLYAAAHPEAAGLDTEAGRLAAGLHRLHEQPPTYDPLTQTLVFDGVELVGGAYHARYTLAPLPVDQVRADLMAAVSAKRWAAETGGLTLPGGATVGTTIDDQNPHHVGHCQRAAGGRGVGGLQGAIWLGHAVPHPNARHRRRHRAACAGVL